MPLVGATWAKLVGSPTRGFHSIPQATDGVPCEHLMAGLQKKPPILQNLSHLL